MLPLFAPPLLAIPFPAFDPVLVSVGPFAIRWYALAYIVGLLGGWWLTRRLVSSPSLWGGTPPMQPADLDDALLWIALGVILGGRLGFVLVYNLDYYAAHPLDALMVWRGGMSFHGGFLGAVVAMVLFARSRGISALSLFDLVAAVVPIGLFLGRIANFINGELWGRVADVPWAVIFPNGGPEPRHPSQLYQAGLEGLLLFAIGMIAVRMGALRRPGLVAALFATGYGIVRIVGEVFRQPDPQLGFFAFGLTMGMILSVPMILAGLWFIRRALVNPPRG
ncbi:prolipoprotein diacylglyceryl transferase [Blastochloris sulfoviridis]|uniref:Phosphatidylglycerol--prolipoprotein diacylglyceryl transferase n=1 Tax=Blastochloris sulfoviridis TaxID=50712 RepID=A0A5M6I262_9HYPH|nr:prolipoprotein diacylglyceryl transferase [Blastochloris sulfoviridis]KAA5602243.1 prolipoprotein diacylglyceryl transferase [Blastochloris sulfoviridis]